VIANLRKMAPAGRYTPIEGRAHMGSSPAVSLLLIKRETGCIVLHSLAIWKQRMPQASGMRQNVSASAKWILLANWLFHHAVGLKALDYGYVGAFAARPQHDIEFRQQYQNVGRATM